MNIALLMVWYAALWEQEQESFVAFIAVTFLIIVAYSHTTTEL